MRRDWRSSRVTLASVGSLPSAGGRLQPAVAGRETQCASGSVQRWGIAMQAGRAPEVGKHHGQLGHIRNIAHLSQERTAQRAELAAAETAQVDPGGLELGKIKEADNDLNRVASLCLLFTASLAATDGLLCRPRRPWQKKDNDLSKGSGKVIMGLHDGWLHGRYTVCTMPMSPCGSDGPAMIVGPRDKKAGITTGMVRSPACRANSISKERTSGHRLKPSREQEFMG